MRVASVYSPPRFSDPRRADEVAPGGGFCGAGERVIELGGGRIGETDQAGALHGAIVLVTQGDQTEGFAF